MASYYNYDPYDSRPRSSRANEPFSRSPNEYYLKPTAGASEPWQRVGERPQGAQNYNSYYGTSPRSSSQYRQDPRYQGSYPPPLPPDTGRPPRQPPSPNRQRSIWPPRPSCEDEVTSLAKEAGTQKLVNEVGRDEAQSRGSIDQEPIIQDVPEVSNHKQRRDVAKPEYDWESSSGLPTPPTSEDEKIRKASRKPSKLSMNFNDVHSVPEMSKRVASPYSYTAPKSAKDDIKTDHFLSPDYLLSPPPLDSRTPNARQPRLQSRSQPTSPRYDSARRSPSSKQGDDYFSLSEDESAVDDTDFEMSDSSSSSHRYKSSTYPPTPAKPVEMPKSSSHTSVVDFAPQSKVASVRRLNLDARRNTDTSNTLPTLPKLRVDKSRHLTPLMAASALSQLSDSATYSSPTTPRPALGSSQARTRGSRHVSPLAVSPAGSTVGASESTTPQRSPRYSAEYARDSPTSKEGSASGSRPSSPSPRTPIAESPRLPKTEVDWSVLLAANAARRSKQPSRLSAEFRQGPMPTVSRPDSRQPAVRTESLPYPVDAGPSTPAFSIPSERNYQYFAETRPSAALRIPIRQDSKTLSRCASPAPNSSLNFDFSTKTSRPSYQSRHSTAEVPQDDRERRQLGGRPKGDELRRESFNSSSQAKKDLQVLSQKGLPPSCPRAKPVAGYNDWYTISSAPNLDICADCIGFLFERTVFRPLFRRSPPVSYNEKVQCALGGRPWIRLAWLLTLQRERTDLNLLGDLARVEETSEQCPGERHAIRSWYGLKDRDGFFVKDFHVCYSDVRKIEQLLPTLSGLFVPLPTRASYDKHLCAIRPEGNRFSPYIDTLIEAHEKAMAFRRPADPSPFLALVRRRQRLRECSRDSLLMNGLWHFIPSVPELTVCEDCFETVVEPEIQKNNDLAVLFNRTVQPVYGEGIGSSCQLYSQHMRKVFKRAVEDKDLRYLTRKAKERREAELRLQHKYLAVRQKASRLQRDGSGSDDEGRRMDREIKRITNEWQTEWE